MSDVTIEAILNAAFRLAAHDGWYAMTVSAVADEAGLPRASLYQYADTPLGLLRLLGRYADAQVLAEAVDGESSTRDNLFDVLMRRLDALHPFREGLRGLCHLHPDALTSVATGGGALYRSMDRMLTAAGDSDLVSVTEKARRHLRILGLCAIWLRVFRVWLKDETPDASITMSALDHDLNNAEMLANSWGGGAGVMAAIRACTGLFRHEQHNA